MITRETGSGKSGNEDALHPLYEEVETMQGTKLYLNRVGGFLVKDRPLALECPPGGVFSTNTSCLHLKIYHLYAGIPLNLFVWFSFARPNT